MANEQGTEATTASNARVRRRQSGAAILFALALSGCSGDADDCGPEDAACSPAEEATLPSEAAVPGEPEPSGLSDSEVDTSTPEESAETDPASTEESLPSELPLQEGSSEEEEVEMGEPMSEPEVTVEPELPETMEPEELEPEELEPEELEPMGGPEPVMSVPPGEYCALTGGWEAEWVAWENDVLAAVNEYRATGFDCDTEGAFGPAEPLAMQDELRCAARMHSYDMFDREYFAHESPEGQNPGYRLDQAGYVGRSWGENIAKGQTSAQSVVDGWMESDGHCSNIMNPGFTLIGVGYHPGELEDFRNRHFWTQTFGS